MDVTYSIFKVNEVRSVDSRGVQSSRGVENLLLVALRM